VSSCQACGGDISPKGYCTPGCGFDTAAEDENRLREIELQRLAAEAKVLASGFAPQ